jgi:uncharacterized protein YacL
VTVDFASRLIGLVVFTLAGIRMGIDLAGYISLSPESSGFIFGLAGMLFGIVITPWITTRPVRALRRSISEWPAERLLMSITGLLFGLLIALLAAYPISLLGGAFGIYTPIALAIISGYLGLTAFGVRAREFADLFGGRSGRGASRGPVVGARKLLLDTSVLIDGRITDIAETGFLGGVLLVPRFVLSELHRVADSSDPLRRNRGRRGLNMLNKLQRSEVVAVRIVEEDFEDISAVDDKLIALALQINASVVTNDYNLNQVANAQSVEVLNINQLANAVRSIYIPGEKFAIRVFQEGKDEGQGVGYLEDGTMVVVENGRRYMDRTITVEVTKLINRETGRMIFAVPESESR